MKAHAELSKEGLDSAKENEIVMELKVSSHTQSVGKVVLRESIPAQVRLLSFQISKNKGYGDGFVGKLTFAK